MGTHRDSYVIAKLVSPPREKLLTEEADSSIDIGEDSPGWKGRHTHTRSADLQVKYWFFQRWAGYCSLSGNADVDCA